MAEGGSPPDGAAATAGLQALMRDWITIWQSELAAGAQDRETQETWQKLLALWAGSASAMVPAWPFPPDGGAGTPVATRSAAAAAASDARDAEIRRLAERVAELERRLAELDRDRA